MPSGLQRKAPLERPLTDQEHFSIAFMQRNFDVTAITFLRISRSVIPASTLHERRDAALRVVS
jgi:hypothetical protein